MDYRDQVKGWTSPETFELLERYVELRQAHWMETHGKVMETRERFWRWVLDRLEFMDRKARISPYVIEEIAGRFNPATKKNERDRAFCEGFKRLWLESLERTHLADEEHTAPPTVDEVGQSMMF